MDSIFGLVAALMMIAFMLVIVGVGQNIATANKHPKPPTSSQPPDVKKS